VTTDERNVIAIVGKKMVRLHGHVTEECWRIRGKIKKVIRDTLERECIVQFIKFHRIR
jgi:hypothetical protein